LIASQSIELTKLFGLQIPLLVYKGYKVNGMSTALVVEDSLTDMQILIQCLQQGGINVLIAQSGEEAIVTATNQRPDVVVLDVVLPGCSGFEVCRILKGEANTSSIPVVMCSTKGGEMDKFWGMKQGADAYLSKPIDQEEFVRTVKQLIKG
jgi:two-component system, chemotaxis family, response regulator PixH